MTAFRHRPNIYFWLLLLLSLSLLMLASLFSISTAQVWLQMLWSICQAQFDQLGLTNLQPMVWQLLILVSLIVILFRGVSSVIYQYRSTFRFVQTFHGLKTVPSTRLQTLLSKTSVTPEQIVFVDLATPQAFCLGLIRPQIWLTTGLVSLLSDDELTAVLAHEAHHCRQRDPLRLLISRALRAAFFFLPVMVSLARAAELQQEISADRSAIRTLGDDLPLLCALQKLIKRAGGSGRSGTAIIRAGIISDLAADPDVILMPFNVTEARLRYLLNPTASINWQQQLKGVILNGLMFTGLSVLIALSSQPVTAHNEVIACAPNSHLPDESYTTWVSTTSLPYR